MEALVSALVSFLLLDPLKADMADRLAAARAPQAVVAEIAACTQTAVPLVVSRASSDPWWVATTAFSLWTGTSHPEAILVEVAPGCTRAVEAARPFLTGTKA